MVKDEVGISRASTYDLPPADFVYGSKIKHKEPTVGETMKNWANIPLKDHRRRGNRANFISGPFGVKSERTSDNIKGIVQTEFTDYTNFDGDYPILPKRKKIVRFPPPKATLSSALLKLVKEKKLAALQVASLSWGKVFIKWCAGKGAV